MDCRVKPGNDGAGDYAFFFARIRSENRLNR
jgi:hypothetical protein